MRQLVFKTLLDYYQNNTYLNLALKNIKHQDINKIALRVYGIIENKLYLEYLINETTNNKKIDTKTNIILMMIVYEYLFINTKKYVVISEYQNLTKKVHNQSLKYITYYLYNLLPEEKITPSFSNEVKNISILNSVPQPIIKLLSKQYPNDYLDIIKPHKKDTYVRLIGKDLLEPNNFSTTQFEDLFICNTNVIQTKDYIDNNIIIQDLGSYLVTKLIDPQPEDTILDLCAAPGNKTMHMYKYCQNIYANEINPSRFNLMKENFLSRSMKITTSNLDATNTDSILVNFKDIKFNKILIDVPCSGLGVINSKPEIKYNITNQTIDDVIKIQRKIIDSSIKLLDINGYLLYSTCSINKNENEENIKYILDNYDFEVVTSKLLDNIIKPSNLGYTLLPNQYNSDGFFMCLLKKKGE